MDRQTFTERLVGMSAAQIVAAVSDTYGEKIEATERGAAVDAAYAVYLRKHPEDAPQSPPGEVQPSVQSTPAGATASPPAPHAPAGGLVYEGRSRTGRKFQRLAGGKLFRVGPKWEPIGELTSEQFERLSDANSKLFMQVRIAKVA